MHAAAIIPAAGRGRRLGLERPKALAPLLGRPLLAWTLEAIHRCDAFFEILIACPPGATASIESVLDVIDAAQAPVRLVAGGETRQESVSRCLEKISPECDLVAVHDAARPLLERHVMLEALSQARQSGAAIAAVPCKDTVKLLDEDGVVLETPDRSRVRLVQTPQCFRRDLLVSAHEKARREGYVATDDAALVERAGASVRVVMGSYENIKITTPEDIMVCEEILKRRKLQCE